jgi:hypothetical protein
MDYELLTSEKQQIILDLAGKAMTLRPALADEYGNENFDQKIVDFARFIAKTIQEPTV